MISSLTSSIEYAGNASTSTPYPVPFRFDDDDWLTIEVTDENGGITVLELGTDYTVTGDGTAEEGNVVTGGGAIPGTSTIAIFRNTPATQTLSLTSTSQVPSAGIERQLDRTVMALVDSVRELSAKPGAPSNKRLRATGTLSPDPADADDGYIDYAGESDGRPTFGTHGRTAPNEDEDYPWVYAFWNSSNWWEFVVSESISSISQWRSFDDVASPELCTTWEEYGGTGALNLDLVASATPGRAGSQRFDDDKLYTNTGTTAAPIWKSSPLTL